MTLFVTSQLPFHECFAVVRSNLHDGKDAQAVKLQLRNPNPQYEPGISPILSLLPFMIINTAPPISDF